MTTLLLLVNATTAGNDLGGAEVRRIRTLKKFLDGESTADPNAKFPDERWFIDRKANESRDSVTFELASKFDLAGQKVAKASDRGQRLSVGVSQHGVQLYGQRLL